jgi:16S rRNA (uracil1498-N3)-methyltransferase
MNLILLSEEDFIETDLVSLADRRFSYIKDVHRASVGDRLTVGLLGGRMGFGSITAMDDRSVCMSVELTLPSPPPLPVTLLLALPRPKVLKRLLFFISAMGVKKIFLINSYRVEKSFWRSPALSEVVLMRQLMLGLEQAEDTILPEINLRPLFKPFVEDELPEIITGSSAFVAHPYAGEDCPRGMNGRIVVAVGPEGGFIPYEIDRLLSCGFKAVSLGKRVLPVEAAVPVLLSRLL